MLLTELLLNVIKRKEKEREGDIEEVATLEEIKVQPTEPQEDSKHVEDMIKKADGVEPDKNDEPVLLAGKYKTEEDLQKGVLELLKHQNEGKSLEEIYKQIQSSKETSQQEEKEEKTPPSTDTTGLDFSPYFEELQTDGSLSEDSYKTLESKGFTKDFVDSYIEGQKALAERDAQVFYSTVGGKENYDAMTKWASLNLSESEIHAFNDAINTNPEMAKLATEALYNRYRTAEGEPPRGHINGSVKATGASGDVYESIQQMTADMAKPEYERDPAFRNKVHDKLSRSKIL